MGISFYGWANDEPIENKLKIGEVTAVDPPEIMSSPPDRTANAIVVSDKGAVLAGNGMSEGLVVGPLEWVRK